MEKELQTNYKAIGLKHQINYNSEHFLKKKKNYNSEQ